MSAKPSVVLADDSKIFRMYFSTLLSRMNFEVLPVRSGQEALDLAKVVSPTMLALDVRMAGESGIDIMKQAREDKDLSKTPIVMISGHAGHAEECFAGGCTDFLTKPININHLHIALQKCQQNREGMRKHLRATINRKVSYTFNNQQYDTLAVTLSEGGIFLHTFKPLPIGSRIDVDVPLGKKESMLLCGEVIYTMDTSRGKFTLPSGMAVRFDTCTPDLHQRLRDEVRDILAGDILEVQEQTLFSHD